MKEILEKIGIVIALVGIGFIAGRFFIPADEIIIEKTVVEWKDKIVYREYQKMEYSDVLKELQSYDTVEPTLKIYQIKSNEIKADAGLHKRNWTGTAKIHQDKNYQYYIGVGAVCLVVGAALMARMRK